MAPINTRSHIVFDKDCMKKYAETLGVEYTAIFEIDLAEDAYGTLFCTKEDLFIGQSGSREEILKIADERVHKEDLLQLRTVFKEKNLKKVIKKDEYNAVEFRCAFAGEGYRWMRILITPDEIEKNTVLCFITDIDSKKKCEFLQKKNEELTELVTKLYGSPKKRGTLRNPIFNISGYKGRAAKRKSAVR